MTTKQTRKSALLAIRAQADAIAALAEALLTEAETEPELEDECPHRNRQLTNLGGEKTFSCPDCGVTFSCPHDRTLDASTMGEPRRFCPDCGRVFEATELVALDS
jgi:uncharacterized C2H2 Zn-finger protein